jgi:hypothetical protein
LKNLFRVSVYGKRASNKHIVQRTFDFEKMSNIIIFIEDRTVSPHALMQLHRATGRSLSEIKNLIALGKPLFESEIFNTDYEQHALSIRAVLDCLIDMYLSFRIYEIPEGETMESYSFVDQCRISVEVLRNILNEADQELTWN